jgi:aldehyde decarbonylase
MTYFFFNFLLYENTLVYGIITCKLSWLHLMQGEELNRYGELYVERHPKLNVKVVDGSSLAVAVVLNRIPEGTTQVVLRGRLTKVAYALAFTLCQRGIQVRLF